MIIEQGKVSEVTHGFQKPPTESAFPYGATP